MGKGNGAHKRTPKPDHERSSSRDVQDYLDDMLVAISKIREYMTGVTQEEFLANSEKQDAVSRRLQIIGEAAKYVPKSLRDKRPEIPWASVVGMRNILSHAYHDEDPRVLWRTVQIRLQALKDAVEDLSKRLNNSSDH